MVINLQTKETITVVYLSPMLHKNNVENLDVLFVMELWLADLHEINSLSCGGKYNTHNPYYYALACVYVK